MAARRSVRSADETTWAIRQKLRSVDVALVELLGERVRLVGRLGRHKRVVGLPLEDPWREEETFRTLGALGRLRGLSPGFVEGLFRAIIAEGKRTVPEPGNPGPPSERPAGRARPARMPPPAAPLPGRPRLSPATRPGAPQAP